jgi:hypothetical protein
VYNGGIVQLQVRFHSDREICATWGPVVIRICDGVRTETDDLRRVSALFDELLENHAYISMLLVFTHGTPMPDGAAQRYASESMRAYDDRLTLAVAMLGLGFWASAVRSTLATLAHMVRRNIWIEGSVEQAIARLTSDLVGIDPDALMVEYQKLWDELVRGARRTG